MIEGTNLDEAEMTLTATCKYCGDTYEHDINRLGDEPENQLADELNEDGWDMLESEKYEMVGLACPRCIDKDDEDR